MSSNVYRAQTVSEITEIIEMGTIESIQGQPTCHSLLKLVNQLAAGCRAITCEYSQYGMSWLVLPQAIYQILTGENIVEPNPVPLVPPYNPNGTQTENTIIQIQWQKNKELCDQMENTNKALITITKSKLDEKHRTMLQSLFTGVPDRTFGAFFDRIFTKWGRTTPFDIDENMD